MKVIWKLTALAFFDQLPGRDKAAVDRSVRQLANNWESLEGRRLQRVVGLADKEGHPVFVLRVGQDLRVILYRRNENVVVVDILRRRQLESMQSTQRSRQ